MVEGRLTSFVGQGQTEILYRLMPASKTTRSKSRILLDNSHTHTAIIFRYGRPCQVWIPALKAMQVLMTSLALMAAAIATMESFRASTGLWRIIQAFYIDSRHIEPRELGEGMSLRPRRVIASFLWHSLHSSNLLMILWMVILWYLRTSAMVEGSERTW